MVALASCTVKFFAIVPFSGISVVVGTRVYTETVGFAIAN